MPSCCSRPTGPAPDPPTESGRRGDFDPLVRRAEHHRFSSEDQTSVELHNRLIDPLAAGDAQQTAEVAFDIWHSLSAQD